MPKILTYEERKESERRFREWQRKYKKENYSVINVSLRKSIKARYQEACAAKGVSVNADLKRHALKTIEEYEKEKEEL